MADGLPATFGCDQPSDDRGSRHKPAARSWLRQVALIETLCQLYLFKQEIGDQITQPRILKLQLSDPPHLFVLERSIGAFVATGWPGRQANQCAGFSPAVICHHADAQ